MTRPNDSFVEVCVARDLVHAHLVKSTLEHAGIPARVTSENLQGALGELPMGYATAPRVVVAPEHAQEARTILDEVHRAERETPGPEGGAPEAE